MTQNASDVEIANQGFAAFRQDLNDVLEDITTLHSGTAAPSTTYANQWWYETDTNKLYIRNEDNDAWIEILTLDQANDKIAALTVSAATVENDLTVGNLVPANGVYLGGTGSANKLDDYEEGTFVPYYSSSSGGTGTVNYTSQRGYYTKIGNRVFVNLYMITSFWGTGGTGELRISGLPHAVSNSTHPFSSMAIGYTKGFINSPAGGYGLPNSTSISLRKHTSSSATSMRSATLSATVGIDVSNGADKNEIICSGFYFTD